MIGLYQIMLSCVLHGHTLNLSTLSIGIQGPQSKNLDTPGIPTGLFPYSTKGIRSVVFFFLILNTKLGVNRYGWYKGGYLQHYISSFPPKIKKGSQDIAEPCEERKDERPKEMQASSADEGKEPRSPSSMICNSDSSSRPQVKSPFGLESTPYPGAHRFRQVQQLHIFCRVVRSRANWKPSKSKRIRWPGRKMRRRYHALRHMKYASGNEENNAIEAVPLK
jgi:hypothetical protein